MKKIVVVSFFLSLAFLVSNASAIQVAPSSNIAQIDSRSDGTHAIMTNGTVPNEGCSNNDRFLIDGSSAGAKDMFALATVALLTGTPVEIAVDGCTKIQQGYDYTAPKVIRISMQ